MIESSSVDEMARKLCKNAVKNASAASNDGLRWIILSLMAEGHKRAAALIDAEAAKLSVGGADQGERHACRLLDGRAWDDSPETGDGQT